MIKNKCEICSKDFNFRYKRKSCSDKCMRLLQSKSNGMKNPEVAKRTHKKLKKMRENGEYCFFMETDRGKKVIGEIARKRALTDNPMWNKEISSKVARKSRITVLKQYASGERKPRVYKYVTYIKKDGKEVKLQSSYEVAYAKFLDGNNVHWICHHEVGCVRLSYELNGEIRTYFPDFYLPSNGTLIDTKSKYIWEKEKEREKIRLVKRDNPNINLIILTEDDLLDLGIHPSEVNYRYGKNSKHTKIRDRKANESLQSVGIA